MTTKKFYEGDLVETHSGRKTGIVRGCRKDGCTVLWDNGSIDRYVDRRDIRLFKGGPSKKVTRRRTLGCGCGS